MSEHTPPPITLAFRNLLLLTSVMAFLLIVLGGIVCVTNASQGCPDWPGCYGRIVPPPQTDAIIEYSHRLVAGLTILLIIASASFGWWRYRSIRWVVRPLLLAVFLAFVVAAFGAFAVLTGLSRGYAALDLGSALLVLAMVLIAGVMTVRRFHNPSIPDRLQLHSSISRLAFWTTVLVYSIFLTGVLVAEPGAIERCVGWPIIGPQMISSGTLGGLQILRRVVEVLATIMIITLVYRILRFPDSPWGTRRFAWITLVALGLAWLLGWGLLIFGFSLGLLVAYVMAVVVLYSALVIITVHAAIPRIGTHPDVN